MRPGAPIAAVVTLASLALASGGAPPIPELSPEHASAIASGRDASASFGDPAFDALTEHTRAWGDELMPQLASIESRRPGLATLEDILGVLAEPDASPGRPMAILCKFAERQPVPKYANWERWLVEPIDPGDPSKRADRAAILFVDRSVSAIATEPREGWYVSAVVRFYKPLELPNRMTGQAQAYPAFVGAIYDVRPRLGVAPSSIFAIIGLAISFLIAAMIVLLVIVNKIRSTPRPVRVVPVAGGAEEGADLPADPAEALARLAGDDDRRHNGEHG